MGEIFGIKFAPLIIPFERRLQTLAVIFWFITILSFVFFQIWSVYILLFSSYRWYLIPYCIWIYWDRETCEKGGRRSQWVRNWAIWRYFRDYFPIKLTKVEGSEFDPKRNYLLCAYPHGILATSFFSCFATNCSGFYDLFPDFEVYPTTLTAHFYTPFFREYSFAFGACASSKDSLNYILSKPGGGNFCALLVGGAEESFYGRPGEYKIVLKKRKGFIRIALQNGSPLVPVFSFGEIDIYNQPNNPPGSKLRWLQNKLKNLTGIAPIIPLGRGIFQYNYGLVPKRRPITTVVGKPVEVPRIFLPTDQQVNEYHKKFTAAIIELFETEKYKYLENPEKAKLVIL